MAKSKAEEWLTEDKLTLLEGWSRDGLTDIQIAKNMGINVSSLYNYKKNHLEILKALKKGKEVVDFEVENALLKKALGYTIALNKQKVTKDGNVIDIVEDMHIPPDTTAQIFWLKNRKPKKWRDKVIDDDDNIKLNETKELLVSIKKVAENNE